MSLKITIKRENIPTVLVCAAIVIYFSYYMINNSYFRNFADMSLLRSVSYLGTISLLLLSILSKNRFRLKTGVVYILLFLLALLVGRQQEESNTFFIIIFFMMAGINTGKDKIFKFSFYVNLIWFILIVGCSNLGIIENSVTTSVFHGDRYCLGFLAPVAPTFFYFLMLTFISYKKENIKIWHLVSCLIVTVYLYWQSEVNAAFYFSIITIVMNYLIRFVKTSFWDGKLCRFIVNLIIPLCIIASFIPPILYIRGNSIAYALNTLTSSRISLSATAIQNYGIKPFGQLLNFNYMANQNATADYFYVDGAYLKYLLMYGFVFMAIILLGYYFLLKTEAKNYNGYMVLVAVASLLYYIFNPQMMYLPYNVYLIIIMQYLTREAISMPSLVSKVGESS